MKSKIYKTRCFANYEVAQAQKKIFEDLNGAVSYPAVKR